ncbi:zf-HC2 domain-containing protein [Cryptosporangium minutisporangium]|uniref:Zf-HC2 domain-containing protein n=1 Tax=Cryptosporangium minutisporangium TaxID=113569 RepID=A0ABP6SSS4_9ACTN
MTTHPNSALIARYATGGDALDEATVWALEAHLESCPGCREALGGAVGADTRTLLDRIAGEIADGITSGPVPVRRRRVFVRRTGVTARVLPWLATAAALMLAAVALERAFTSLPSLVLLLAPVTPLLPVAAAWSRRSDPAWELLAASPRAGLGLLLRRTLTVLAAVLPVLAVAGWWTGHAPALWLLPCVAFTAGSLALGGVTGVDRAALALAGLWSVAVVAPSLIAARLPAVLETDSWPVWTVLTAALLLVVGVRSDGYRRLGRN